MPNSPSKEKPKTIFLKDYRPPDYFIKTVDLHFDLGEEVTTVRSLLTIASNGDHPRPLVLDGRELILKSIKLNAKSLTNEDYTVDDESLTLPRTRLGTPEAFTLEIETEIKPQANILREEISVPNAKRKAFAKSPIFPIVPMSCRDIPPR